MGPPEFTEPERLPRTPSVELREQLIHIAVAQIANQIDPPFAVREEFRVDLACVKARHGTAIQYQSPRGKDEVGRLQRTVTERGLVDQRLIADEIRTHVGMRKESGKLFAEFRIPGDDDCDWRGYCFLDVQGYQR